MLPWHRRGSPIRDRIHIALLRGINVGGHKPVAMAALRELAERLGLREPRTVLQSGNLVFGSRSGTPAGLERRLEAEARTRLGLETSFLIRTAAEWDRILERNPFPREAAADPGHLLVVVLKNAPNPAAVRALATAIVGRERVRAAGRELYVFYPDGVGRSKLSHSLIEKRLGTRGTARNWNTARKLQALAAAFDAA